MERLFTNPEWNNLADTSQLSKQGIVEDQINRTRGRILHRADRMTDQTLSL